jgi:hypothetical protein
MVENCCVEVAETAVACYRRKEAIKTRANSARDFVMEIFVAYSLTIFPW